MQTLMTSTFAERLKTVLEEQNIKQVELCEKANIGKSAMSQYLHGAFIPKQQKLTAIAEVLGVSEKWLMGYDVSRNTLDSKPSESEMEVIVKDNSMKKMNIPKGARARIRKTDNIRQAKIVSFTLNDEGPMLRFYHSDGDRIILTAADPAYPPIICGADDLETGKLIIHGEIIQVTIKIK
ncbi:MAG: helix-turn-helix domain-containing protein [Firmicutes bacterium]|nr:helix-turn-helix domain-containing protein [Bacillota bacterium]